MGIFGLSGGWLCLVLLVTCRGFLVFMMDMEAIKLRSLWRRICTLTFSKWWRIVKNLRRRKRRLNLGTLKQTRSSWSRLLQFPKLLGCSNFNSLCSNLLLQVTEDPLVNLILCCLHARVNWFWQEIIHYYKSCPLGFPLFLVLKSCWTRLNFFRGFLI